MLHTLRLLTVIGGVLAAVTSAQAQSVTLRTENDSVQLTGKLISFDGKTYALETSIGVIQLAAGGLICEGEGCPVMAPDLDFAASGVTALTEGLLPALMSAYGNSSGTAVQVGTRGGDAQYTTEIGNDDASMTVTTSGTDAAFADLLDGRTNLALTTRSATPQELSQFASTGVTALRESILAVDGLVILAPKSNALPSISIRNVARIFSGEIQNWSQLGGADARITLYTRDDQSAIAEVFETLVLDPVGQSMASNVSVLSSDDAVARSVAQDPNGIGFARYSDTDTAKQLPIIGQCGLVVTPSEFNIRAEEYPLSYRMRAVTTDKAQSDLLEAVLAFASTDAAQSAVAASGMINQSLARSPVDQQGMRFASALQSKKVIAAIPRLQTMVSEMVISERLSATFRFEAGSRELDERGRRDIERVAQLLRAETASGSGKTVRLMGFTDSLGNADLNQELSVRRAQQVLESLMTIAPDLKGKVTFLPMGFGDVSPIGCDQSTIGRWINRRVEVWISAAAQ